MSESIGVTFSGNKNIVTMKLNLQKFGKRTLFYVVTYVQFHENINNVTL